MYLAIHKQKIIMTRYYNEIFVLGKMYLHKSIRNKMASPG